MSIKRVVKSKFKIAKICTAVGRSSFRYIRNGDLFYFPTGTKSLYDSVVNLIPIVKDFNDEYDYIDVITGLLFLEEWLVPLK